MCLLKGVCLACVCVSHTAVMTHSKIIIETFHKKKREAMELSELINGLKRKIDQVSMFALC